MSERKPIPPLKRYPYLGLFQYPFLPSLLRRIQPVHNMLPANNPYVGTFNHSFGMRPIINIGFNYKIDVETQTDPVPSMIIGEKIIAAYGEQYNVLLNN